MTGQVLKTSQVRQVSPVGAGTASPMGRQGQQSKDLRGGHQHLRLLLSGSPSTLGELTIVTGEQRLSIWSYGGAAVGYHYRSRGRCRRAAFMQSLLLRAVGVNTSLSRDERAKGGGDHSLNHCARRICANVPY